eukprot:TRINITY_DN83483_c0_g1_i1.p1 TRINITY_DN83483_c0_g1~~TRINITY_DN83483_c0_g1_i1.p1  ORF type:complete len:354 (-),score=53.07 TRINITY_DN83483_c0_g1_i1:58-1119(-)
MRLGHSSSPQFVDLTAQLEGAILEGSRQTAARCSLICSELIQAAREDERQALRDRLRESGGTSLPSAAKEDYAKAWAYGFFDPRQKAIRSEDDKPSLSSLLDAVPSRGGPGVVDIEWIVRTSFRIMEFRKALREGGESGEVEASAPKPAPEANPEPVDEEMREQLVLFGKLIRTAKKLWQEKLLQDQPSVKRRATVNMGKSSGSTSSTAKWKHETTGHAPGRQQTQMIGGSLLASDEGRQVLTPLPPLKEDDIRSKSGAIKEAVREVLQDRSPRKVRLDDSDTSVDQSPPRPPRSAKTQVEIGRVSSPDTSPSKVSRARSAGALASKKDLHNDLSRELAELAEDLRKAQIISQ